MTYAATALAPSAPLRRPAPARIRTASPRLLLVANANASAVTKHRELFDGALGYLRRFGGAVEARLTESTDELAAVVSEEERRLVLLGGDGTVHAAANVAGHKPELALIPAGRANNLARGLGIPVELEGAAKPACRGASRRVVAIVAKSAQGRYLALEGVSVGYHALARANYHGTNSADMAAGIKAGVGALARFEPITIAIETDGDLEVLKLSQLFVANFPLFGFGLNVAPGADPTDGLLDVVNIETKGRASLVAMLNRLRHGTHIGRPGVRHWQARRIRIATGGRSPVIADTTNLGSGPVDLSVERAAVELVAPEGRS